MEKSIANKKGWSNFDYGLHGYIGFGNPVTLSQIGHLSGVIKKSEHALYPQVEKALTAHVKEIKSGSIEYDETFSISYKDALTDPVNIREYLLGSSNPKTSIDILITHL